METDAEIQEIDRIEDRIAPLDENTSLIRNLISSLELCHHKAERWVDNLIEAIGTGETDKGLGTRQPGEFHLAETVWQNACTALSNWCSGRSAAVAEVSVGPIPASELLARLGERSPLKEWQVQRVVDKVRSHIHWPRSENDPALQYAWILLDASAYELGYHKKCPEYFSEHESFWLETVRTVIHDTADGKDTALSLGLAIDMLMPCHWRFVENLQIVLDAIGGKLDPPVPFAACGRNITLLPRRHRMKIVSDSLLIYAGAGDSIAEFDRELLDRLGDATDVKRWLALSLAKTLRLQMDPPPELQVVSALTGPDWLES
jgi:hypothetical protein